jgi:hypothetical protein
MADSRSAENTVPKAQLDSNFEVAAKAATYKAGSYKGATDKSAAQDFRGAHYEY